jgi:hypothetical protein
MGGYFVVMWCVSWSEQPRPAQFLEWLEENQAHILKLIIGFMGRPRKL